MNIIHISHVLIEQYLEMTVNRNDYLNFSTKESSKNVFHHVIKLTMNHMVQLRNLIYSFLTESMQA